LKKSKPTASRL